jgi:Smg protein
MNENVIEIVSYLVKRIMHNEGMIEDEKKLVKNLVNQGYEIDDIDMAFELIFSSNLNTNQNNNFEAEEGKLEFNNSQRVLDFKEKFKLSLSAQGVLIRLSTLDLISDEELEKILDKSVHSRKPEINLKDLWKVLQKIINNPARLSLVIENSPEFKSINEEHKRYIN